MSYLKRELYELVKSEASIFDFIQESSLDGLWYRDLENPENEWMNPAFWTTLGYNPGEMPHRADAWQPLIHPEDLEIATRNALRHWQDPSHPYDQVVRYRHKNGSTVWIRCRGLAICDGQGKPVRMLGAHTDITQVKQQEAELLKANARLKELLNNTGDMVFVLDEAYTFTEYYRNNDQGSSLFVPPSFFIGRKVVFPGKSGGFEKSAFGYSSPSRIPAGKRKEGRTSPTLSVSERPKLRVKQLKSALFQVPAFWREAQSHIPGFLR